MSRPCDGLKWLDVNQLMSQQKPTWSPCVTLYTAHNSDMSVNEAMAPITWTAVRIRRSWKDWQREKFSVSLILRVGVISSLETIRNLSTRVRSLCNFSWGRIHNFSPEGFITSISELLWISSLFISIFFFFLSFESLFTKSRKQIKLHFRFGIWRHGKA